MLKINPSGSNNISHELHQARKSSGLNNTHFIKILAEKYGEEMSDSALSHSIWHGTIQFRRALMILSMWGH